MRENKSNGKRIVFLRIFFVLIFILYSARLFSMQILSGEIHLLRAQNISRRVFPIPAQRGEIFDRNFDVPLVINRDAFAVNITPADVPRGRMNDIVEAVSEILNISADDIYARLPRQYLQLFQPFEIASNVPFSAIAALAERRDTLPGISWHIKPVRNYGNAGSLAHILGYVGEITREELTVLLNRGYQMGDIIGKAGIERQYDELLRGRDGRETRTVDARGRRIPGREHTILVPPVMGRNLVLTIDRRLQTLAERALGPRNGSVVILRPATGEVLAMVSFPWYDPNIFTDGSRSYFRILAEDPNRPFLNRAIQSSFPPASTFKIIMSTAMLAENAFPVDQTILCTGSVNFGNRDWHCHNRHVGHGRLNMNRALAHSCNIFYWITGRDHLGVERIISYSREFGFGELTGIDLPGETAGFIPTPQWKERRFHERWVAGDTMNMAIGQGFSLVTPLQMANMVAMVVNSGRIYRPHLLKQVRDPATNAIEFSAQPEVLFESSINPQVFETVRRDMRAVVTSGTARHLNSRIVEIAGKTGTAEIGLQDRWHQWMVSYAPHNGNIEEKIVVVVFVEAATGEEYWPIPASAIIYQGYFANQTFEEAIRALGFWRLVAQEQGQ